MPPTDRNWALDLNIYGSFKTFRCGTVRVKKSNDQGEEDIPSSLIPMLRIRRNLARKTKQKEEKL